MINHLALVGEDNYLNKNMKIKTKKILIIIGIILAILLIVYFVFKTIQTNRNDSVENFNFDDFVFDVDLYSSVLGEDNLPSLELNDPLDFEFTSIGVSGASEIGKTPVPSISLDNSIFNFSSPQINPSIPQKPTNKKQETPSSAWEPNASDCNLFSAAPSCAYIPEQNREMCEKCRAAGF